MKQKTSLYSLDELKDQFIGQEGTPQRDQYEAEVSEALQAYRVGEAIKEAREQQNLTQQELSERIGLKPSQISRMEKGQSISLSTLSRVLKALGVRSATLNLEGAGNFALW